MYEVYPRYLMKNRCDKQKGWYGVINLREEGQKTIKRENYARKNS